LVALAQALNNQWDVPHYLRSGIGRAQLVVADAARRLVRTIDLPARSGLSQVTLDMSTLSAGSYQYRLVVDGRVVATRQMQLVK
jgi:hypothetical protein